MMFTQKLNDHCAHHNSAGFDSLIYLTHFEFYLQLIAVDLRFPEIPYFIIITRHVNRVGSTSAEKTTDAFMSYKQLLALIIMQIKCNNPYLLHCEGR